MRVRLSQSIIHISDENARFFLRRRAGRVPAARSGGHPGRNGGRPLRQESRRMAGRNFWRAANAAAVCSGFWRGLTVWSCWSICTASRPSPCAAIRREPSPGPWGWTPRRRSGCWMTWSAGRTEPGGAGDGGRAAPHLPAGRGRGAGVLPLSRPLAGHGRQRLFERALSEDPCAAGREMEGNRERGAMT